MYCVARFWIRSEEVRDRALKVLVKALNSLDLDLYPTVSNSREYVVCDVGKSESWEEMAGHISAFCEKSATIALEAGSGGIQCEVDLAIGEGDLAGMDLWCINIGKGIMGRMLQSGFGLVLSVYPPGGEVGPSMEEGPSA
tara:strand:- start:50 stop:469 length:420 start_codon:yes stop_codon:yes gene_type:complete